MPSIIYVGFQVFNRELVNNFKYLDVPKPEAHHGELGHEIHRPRLLLIDMLNKLTKDDIVITSEDRKFMYQEFCNVLSYEELLENEEKYINYEKIDLCTLGTYEQLLLNDNVTKLYPTSNLIKKYAPMFSKYNLIQVLDKPFILIHYRKTLVTHADRDNNNEDINHLIDIFKTFTIIIFCQEKDKIYFTDYYTTSNLQEYVTLMNCNNCLYLVSLFSGGGQLSQYFCNNNVLYFNTKHTTFIIDIKLNYWDQTTISNVKRYFFNHIEELKYYVIKSNFDSIILENMYAPVENIRLMYKLNYFDWTWYIIYYNLKGIINNREEAEFNYLHYGRNQNKVINPILLNFDWQFYLTNNKDLLDNGICNKELAEMHYIKHGREEKRICNKISYKFTNNWFDEAKHNFDKYLIQFINQPVTFLEIGCFEGAATTYCLNNILTHENAKIYIIDTFEGSMEHNNDDCKNNLFNNFTYNIELTNAAHKVIINKGYSHDILKILDHKFDFIYIDASHTSYDVLADAILAFPLLKMNGIMIFDDYEWITYQDETLNPKIGIDSFLSCYRNFIRVLEINCQVIIRKIS